MRWRSSIAYLLLLPACSKAMPVPSQVPIELSAASSAATVPVEAPSGRVMIDVTQVTNPRLAPVTIIVEDNGVPPMTDRFSLYPPDRPGRFPVRLSRGATRARISLLTSRDKASADLHIHLTVGEALAR